MYRYDDLSIMREFVAQLQGLKQPPTLKPRVFEKEHDLDPTPSEPFSNRILNTAFSLVSPSLKERAVKPSGDSPWEQIASLLPQDKGLMPDDETFKESFTYALCRIVVGGLTRGIDWNNRPQGLDYLSAALMTIHVISNLTGERVPWLDILYTKPEDAGLIVNRPILNLRPDGPTAHEWNVVHQLRSKVKSLRFTPLVRTCEHLADTTRPVAITKALVKRATGLSYSWCQRLADDISLVMTERFVLSMRSLGLRYRCVLTDRQRFRDMPRHGLAWRTLLTKDCSPKSITMYLEPIESEGPTPEQIPEDAVHFTVDTETVSMRMDHFNETKKDGGEIGAWEVAPWKKTRKAPEAIPSWLFRRSPPASGNARKLSKAKVDILGPVWMHRGSHSSRKRFFRELGFPDGTVLKYLKNMIDDSLLSCLYHPTLEYSGLPECVVVAVFGAPRRKIERISEYIIHSSPYVDLLTCSSGRNLYAHIHVPAFRAMLLIGPVKQRLDDLGVNYMTGTMDTYRSYLLTVLHRLYNRRSPNAWRDPWTLES